jgi:hypothetical protein
MAFDTAIKKVVGKILKTPGIGGSIVYRQVTAGTYNSTSGEIKGTTTDTSLKGLFQDINDEEVKGLIQADDRKCMIAADALSFIPSTADKIVAAGITYQIIKVKTIEQAGTQINYLLYLRA